MKSYYNKTQQDIPYIVTDFQGYAKCDFMRHGNYFPTKPWRNRNYAGFNIDERLVAIFKRKDFNKLTPV